MIFRYLDSEGQPREHALPVDAELLSFEGGLGVLRTGGRLVRFALHGEQVWVDGRVFTVARPQGPRRSGAAAGASADNRIKAQMPGTILAVRVAEGDDVEAGQTLVLMESMKMEMAVEAPRAARVQAVHCRPGQMVEMEALLVELG